MRRHANKSDYPGTRQPKIPRAAAVAAPLLVSILVLIGGCGGSNALKLPPVTESPTGQYQVGRFVWFDLLTEDVPGAKAFYSDLFGWRIDSPAGYPDYHVIYLGKKAIGGMAALEGLDGGAPESLWMPSLSVVDINRAAEQAVRSGGTVLEGPLKAGGRGKIALITDPAGAPLFLLRAAKGDPTPEPASPGNWVWVDLFTRDAGVAGDFYVSLAGYQADIVETKENRSYHILKWNGSPRAGIVELDWKGLEDNWLPYVKVNRLEPIIEKARELGAKLILQAENVAIMADPAGAAFGIQAPWERSAQ